jgi:hypothetical protein
VAGSHFGGPVSTATFASVPPFEPSVVGLGGAEASQSPGQSTACLSARPVIAAQLVSVTITAIEVTSPRAISHQTSVVSDQRQQTVRGFTRRAFEAFEEPAPLHVVSEAATTL